MGTPTGTIAYVPDQQNGRFIWVSERTKPGDSFFEVYEPFLYFPLQLKNPSRFGQIWPSEYTRPEHVAETVRDLSADPPQYILWDNGYNLAPETRKPSDNTGPLADFVRLNYEPVGPVYPISGREIQGWERKRVD